MGARYYDPEVGRFVSRDAVLSEHPYLYWEHEPIMRVDPSGRIAETIWDIGNIAYDIYTKDWGNLVFDVGAALIPFVPAGLGKATKVIKVFDDNQQALIDLAKWAKKRGGITEEAADILLEWAKEYGIYRQKHEPHPGRRINFWHIRIGRVNHIRIIDK